MTPSQIIQATADYIRQEFQHDSSGHDWWHIYRVWRNALAICEHEKADRFVVELAALLHDLDDWKLEPTGDGTPVKALAWIRGMGTDAGTCEHVREIITHLSFKGACEMNRIQTLEGMIVQDADRLDAIGAMGIARAFAYGGSKGRIMHDPGVAPQLHATFEQYKKSEGTTINHFHEKLLLLKERMNTPAARRIAEGRHAFMEQFLAQFQTEWENADH
jgi:uncharacterized protein